jgi:hypothetical protein
MVQTTPNTFTKTSSDGNWDGRVYSQEAYDHAYMSWQTDSTSGYAMAALTADPTASTSYSTLDYAWYYADGGSLAIFENGSSIGTFGSYTTSTITTIEYDGSTVKYYKDGVLQRSSAATHGTNPLYFSSSTYSTGKTWSVVFGPMGAQGTQGTQGIQGITSPDADITIVSCLFT